MPYRASGHCAAGPVGQIVRAARALDGRGTARDGALLARHRRRRARHGVPVAALRRVPPPAAPAIPVLLSRAAAAPRLPHPSASARLADSQPAATPSTPVELPPVVSPAASRGRATRAARAAAAPPRHGLRT